MVQKSAGFMCVKNKFPRISDVKMKVGIFIGHQIRVLIQDVKCEDQLSEVGKSRVERIKKCHYQLLGYYKRENYRDMVTYVVVKSYKAMGCNVF